MTTTTETTYRVWSCGRCRHAYKAVPAMELGCHCATPVAALRPSFLTVMAAAPRKPVRPAGELDRLRAQFARKGKRITVTLTGTVVGAMVANGEELFLTVETADHRRFTVRPSEGDVLAEPKEQP